jgi:hypothetical protein
MTGKPSDDERVEKIRLLEAESGKRRQGYFLKRIASGQPGSREPVCASRSRSWWKRWDLPFGAS